MKTAKVVNGDWQHVDVGKVLLYHRSLFVLFSLCPVAVIASTAVFVSVL